MADRLKAVHLKAREASRAPFKSVKSACRTQVTDLLGAERFNSEDFSPSLFFAASIACHHCTLQMGYVPTNIRRGRCPNFTMTKPVGSSLPRGNAELQGIGRSGKSPDGRHLSFSPRQAGPNRQNGEGMRGVRAETPSRQPVGFRLPYQVSRKDKDLSSGEWRGEISRHNLLESEKSPHVTSRSPDHICFSGAENPWK